MAAHSMNAFYWMIPSLVLAKGIAQQRNRRRSQMGPRIQVTDAEFLKLAEKERGLVIRGPKVFLGGITYVLRSGDYYYYTFTKTPLALPKECQILESKQILL